MVVEVVASGPRAEPIAVVTLFSQARLDHVLRQQAALAADDSVAVRVLVWLDPTPPPVLEALADARVLHVPPGPHGMRLAEGRNRAAAAALAADARLVVFLDADCVPGPDLVARYDTASREHPDALLCGPVTYLPEGFVAPGEGPIDLERLAGAVNPHPARPAPADGSTLVAADTDFALFWSLSFAVTAATWLHLGGFDPGYEGYGGEDTDFAFAARDTGVQLVWVGGAHAFHQHHPTSTPPWQHLDDILRNGGRFASRWGFWPMEGWLRAFAAAGAVECVDGTWKRTP